MRLNPFQCNISQGTNCGCYCGVLAADLEGVKLELVIMQKSIKTKLSSADRKSSREDDEIIRLKQELFSEREKCKRLEADLTIIVKERNREVDELKDTIASLDNIIKTTEAINESLRAAIMHINSEKAVKEKAVKVNQSQINPTHADSEKVKLSQPNQQFNDYANVNYSDRISEKENTVRPSRAGKVKPPHYISHHREEAHGNTEYTQRHTEDSVFYYRPLSAEWLNYLLLIESPVLSNHSRRHHAKKPKNEAQKSNNQEFFRARINSQENDWLNYLELVRYIMQ